MTQLRAVSCSKATPWKNLNARRGPGVCPRGLFNLNRDHMLEVFGSCVIYKCKGFDLNPAVVFHLFLTSPDIDCDLSSPWCLVIKGAVHSATQVVQATAPKDWFKSPLIFHLFQFTLQNDYQGVQANPCLRSTCW
jgi:hypothetical protein